MRRTCGRPQKYSDILQALDDQELYTPGTIAVLARQRGFVADLKSQQKVRISMGRLRDYHSLPDPGDGLVRISGQAPTPGWYGWRWKLLSEEFGERAG